VDQPTHFRTTTGVFQTSFRVLVATTLMVTPLLVMRPALDVFRTPKDVFFQTMALAIFAVGVTGALLSDRIAESIRTHRKSVAIAAGAVVWTGVTSLLSMRPEVSMFKTLTVFCLAVLFTASIWVTWQRGVGALLAVIAPAVINAIVAVLQSSGSAAFSVVVSENARLSNTALIGNPNELGGYFVLPLLASIAGTVAWPRLRWLWATTALLLAAGIAASQSVTPIIASASGVGAILFLPAARRFRWFAVAAFFILVTAVSLHPGVRSRMRTLVTDARAGNLSEMTSFRLPAFAAAVEMFRDHPAVGVGPGVFSALYMPYKLRLDSSNPEWIRVGNQNFGEVHNDHLQLLAETGLPGYVLFVTALALLAQLSFRKRDQPDERTRFVQMFAFPAVIAFAVLALAHFPMQLTSTIAPAVYIAALCFAWVDVDEVA
jgi:O-antigen ligase